MIGKRTRMLEEQLQQKNKDIAKKELLIGILTEHIGGVKAATVVARGANYGVRSLAIQLGKSPTEEQIAEITKGHGI